VRSEASAAASRREADSVIAEPRVSVRASSGSRRDGVGTGASRGGCCVIVIDAVERLNLTAFYAAYRLDEQGRAAHEPSMMVALLLYSYALGERSSRRSPTSCSPS
jgi:hypothetical protein